MRVLAAKNKTQWESVTWEQGCAEVSKLTDKLGCKVDAGIFDAVVTLNLLGLRTCQSCEGHLDYGLPYPWIDFETDEFPAFKQALEDADREELSVEEKEARGAQLIVLAASLPTRSRLYMQLEQLLCAYYKQHPTIPEEWHIIVNWLSPILFRIMPFCAYEAYEWPASVCAENLARGQTEMQKIASWLHEYWQGKRIFKGDTHELYHLQAWRN